MTYSNFFQSGWGWSIFENKFIDTEYVIEPQVIVCLIENEVQSVFQKYFILEKYCIHVGTEHKILTVLMVFLLQDAGEGEPGDEAAEEDVPEETGEEKTTE